MEKDLVGRDVAQQLRDEAEGNPAARPRPLRVACKLAVDLFDRSQEIGALRRDAFVEAVRLQGGEPAGIVGLAGHRLDELVAIVPARKRHHELDILHVFAVIVPELIEDHVDEARAGGGAEFVERLEEFVVIGRNRDGRHERARRERVDQLIVKLLVVHGVGRGHVAGLALRLRQQDVCRIRAEILLCRPGDEPFSVDGAGQVGVKVAALRHAPQEGAQVGEIGARRVEPGAGDDRVELARDHGQANSEEDGRQEENGDDNATCHGPPPCCTLFARKARMRAAKREAGSRGVESNLLTHACGPLHRRHGHTKGAFSEPLSRRD